MDQLASPFPGMDPYLEARAGWSSVHGALITHIMEWLAERLPPRFVARSEQRIYITAPGDPDRQTIEPDVVLAREPRTTYATPSPPFITPPTLLEVIDPDPEIFDRYIEIRDAHSREVVATIEVLSPFNKQPGAQGYKAFQEKRIDVMASSVHWIEIDLLRAGMRPAEVAYRSDYYALLSRGDRRQPYEGWFFDLRDRMPTIAVPLRPPHADVPLDLQTVFGAVYIRGRYAYDVDYMLPAPPPPLHPDDEQWLRHCIDEWQANRPMPSPTG